MKQLTTHNPILSRLSDKGLLAEIESDPVLYAEVLAAQPNEARVLLVERGVVSEAEFVEALAEHLGVPFMPLSPSLVQADALSSIPPDVLEELNALPILIAESWLTVAIEGFDDPTVIERIEKSSGCHVQPIAATAENIRSVRSDCFAQYGFEPTQQSDLAAHHKDLGASSKDALNIEVIEETEIGAEDLAASSDTSPVLQVVNRIIREAAEAGASDIHIEPHDKEFRTRYRVDGHLRESCRTSMQMLPAVVSRIKILSGLDISQRRLPQDGGMSVRIEGRCVDLRVSTMTTKYGEKVVMRLVERDANLAALETLGFSDEMLGRLRTATKQPNGIALVTGPTGSGKSTTLYAILAELLSEKHNISTVEDPVERKLLGANQFQINVSAGFTFSAALRSLLRQDPDVLMVGEVRDNETARLAMEAALTGHLVFSTLHTNDALTAVSRLINMGVEPYLVAASVRAVLAQRLVRRLCLHCREPIEVNAGQSEILARLYPERAPLHQAFHSQGCSVCNHTGCSGRAGVFELLTFDESLLSCILREGGIDQLRTAVRAQGQATMLEDGLDKVAQGVIGLEGLFEVIAPSVAAIESST